MTWGAPISSEWGAAGNLPDVLQSRLLQFLRLGPNASGYVRALARRTADFLDSAQSIADAFDIDTAVGAQLDTLGALLQRPRGLADDETYRVLLRIQVLLILSSTGSAETLLEIVRRYSGEVAPEYVEHWPAEFRIAAAVELDAAQLLARLIRQARAEGVRAAVTFIPPSTGALVCDLDGDPLDSPGVLDLDGDPLPDALPLALTLDA